MGERRRGTRDVAIVHAALRRDLERTFVVLDQPQRLWTGRLRPLGAHVLWLLAVLHDQVTWDDDRPIRPVIDAAAAAATRVRDPGSEPIARAEELRASLETLSRRVEVDGWTADVVSGRTRPARDVAYAVHWLLDGLGSDEAQALTAALPPLPRVLVRYVDGGYGRQREAVWGGTGALRIGSVPVPSA